MVLAVAARRQRSSVTKMPEELQHLATRLRAAFAICIVASLSLQAVLGPRTPRDVTRAA